MRDWIDEAAGKCDDFIRQSLADGMTIGELRLKDALASIFRSCAPEAPAEARECAEKIGQRFGLDPRCTMALDEAAALLSSLRDRAVEEAKAEIAAIRARAEEAEKGIGILREQRDVAEIDRDVARRERDAAARLGAPEWAAVADAMQRERDEALRSLAAAESRALRAEEETVEACVKACDDEARRCREAANAAAVRGHDTTRETFLARADGCVICMAAIRARKPEHRAPRPEHGKGERDDG